jgi:hypothetical protein
MQIRGILMTDISSKHVPCSPNAAVQDVIRCLDKSYGEQGSLEELVRLVKQYGFSEKCVYVISKDTGRVYGLVPGSRLGKNGGYGVQISFRVDGIRCADAVCNAEIVDDKGGSFLAFRRELKELFDSMVPNIEPD